MTPTKISSKTSQQVVSPVIGFVLGFYYHPLTGFLVALAFGFQESPFKVKNKYLGCKVNWQLFLIYFVIGLACQVLNATLLFLGLFAGAGLRWYFSDGDLSCYQGYLKMATEYLQEKGLHLNMAIFENTDWIFKYLSVKKENEENPEPDNSNLDGFLNQSQTPASTIDTVMDSVDETLIDQTLIDQNLEEDLEETYQENPSTVSNPSSLLSGISPDMSSGISPSSANLLNSSSVGSPVNASETSGGNPTSSSKSSNPSGTSADSADSEEP